MTSRHGGAKTPYEQLLEDLLVERHRPVPPPPHREATADPARWKPMDDLTRKRVVDEVWAAGDAQALIARANRKAAQRPRGRVLSDHEIEALG